MLSFKLYPLHKKLSLLTSQCITTKDVDEIVENIKNPKNPKNIQNVQNIQNPKKNLQEIINNDYLYNKVVKKNIIIEKIIKNVDSDDSYDSDDSDDSDDSGDDSEQHSIDEQEPEVITSEDSDEQNYTGSDIDDADTNFSD